MLKEYIHNTARTLIATIPDCIDISDQKMIVAYRVGVMKLAEVLTGQNAMTADKETASKFLKIIGNEYQKDPRWEKVKELRKKGNHAKANELVLDIRSYYGID